MKFLVDAQLPRRFAIWLTAQGHDAKHTLELPLGNRTPDSDIIALVERENRVAVTKDDDFVQSFLVNDQPHRLLLIATGNIGNADLERLVAGNLASIVEALDEHRFVELGRDFLTIHQ